MANFLGNEIKKYFDDLSATHEIVTQFGVAFTGGTNLFIGIEDATSTKCLTILPYPGGKPYDKGERQESAFQIRLKIKDAEKGFRTTQSIINRLDNNDNILASANGVIHAVQSSPILLETQEGGEIFIFVANFGCRHIKL